MRARDFIKEDRDDLAPLKEACENWMEMYFDANDINTILNHPYSQQFKKPPASIDRLYRGLVVKGNKFKAVPGKSNRKFVAYATHQYGAEAFLASIDAGGRQVIIEKQFNPGDFLLDFTGLYESLFPEAQDIFNRYETEYEVWMRATPYYSSVNEKEIVKDTAWGQTDDGAPGRGNLSELTDNDYYGGNDDDNILPWADILAALKQWAEDSNAIDFEERDGGRTAATTWGPELGAPYSGYVMFVSPHGDGEMYGMLFGMYEDGQFDMIQQFKAPASMNGVNYAARVYMQVRM